MMALGIRAGIVSHGCLQRAPMAKFGVYPSVSEEIAFAVIASKDDFVPNGTDERYYRVTRLA